MKLIDILVRELPKRGGWPIESNGCRQFPDGEVCFSNVGKKPDFYTECATDVDLVWRKTVTPHVSREQYEAALAASQKVEWDGVGLPPVGCECEALYDESDDGDMYFKAKIIAHDNGYVIGRWLGGNPEHTLFEYTESNRDYRPLRTEADKKRDAAKKAISELRDRDGYKLAACMIDPIYDAIAAGNIPGVKLED